MKRKLFIGGLILLAVLVWLDLWLDEHWVRSFIERERMTARPEPHFRASGVDWA